MNDKTTLTSNGQTVREAFEAACPGAVGLWIEGDSRYAGIYVQGAFERFHEGWVAGKDSLTTRLTQAEANLRKYGRHAHPNCNDLTLTPGGQLGPRNGCLCGLDDALSDDPAANADDALLCEHCDSQEPLTTAICLGCWNKLAAEVIELRKLKPSPGETKTERRETGWVVENGKRNSEYRGMDASGIHWTTDIDKALRFARREDAEAFASGDEDAWRIVEHLWVTPSVVETSAPLPTCQHDLLMQPNTVEVHSSTHASCKVCKQHWNYTVPPSAPAAPEKQCNDPGHNDFQRNAPWIAGGDF